MSSITWYHHEVPKIFHCREITASRFIGAALRDPSLFSSNFFFVRTDLYFLKRISNLRKDGYFWPKGEKLSTQCDKCNGINNFCARMTHFEKPSFENINCSTHRDLSYGITYFCARIANFEKKS